MFDRRQRIKLFGIDAYGPGGSDGVLFRGGEWTVGEESTLLLTVKNVTSRMVKLKYALPSTRFFGAPFPVVMKLPPGILKTIEVAFRPTDYQNYDDTMFFKLYVTAPPLLLLLTTTTTPTPPPPPPNSPHPTSL